MSTGAAPSAYDTFAPIYSRWMAEDFARRAWPAVERLFLSRLAAGAQVLDVCCGSGQMARALLDHGCRVTGVDASEEMLRLARENAPQAEFICADARSRKLATRYDGALSTFNSLAHFASVAELTRVFCNVAAALRPGAPFLFDLSMEEAYASQWRGSFGVVTEAHACILRPSYDPEQRVGRNALTVFCRDGADIWRRSDFVILQKCHSEQEIRSALTPAGFTDISVFDGQRDLGIGGEAGRAFFLCRSPR